MLFRRQLFVSKIIFVRKIFQEYYQNVKQFGSRSDPTIWVQTVCKTYRRQRVKQLPVNISVYSNTARTDRSDLSDYELHYLEK